MDGSRDRRVRSGHRNPPKRVFFRRQEELLWDTQDRSGIGRGTGPAIWNEEDGDMAHVHESSFLDLGMGRKRRYTVGIMGSWKPSADDSP
jgi:hypothetical protein